MKRFAWIAVVLAGALAMLTAQDRATIDITKGGASKPHIAIPQFRGSGPAQNFMGAFNETLRGDIVNSGLLVVVPETMYWKTYPQQPSDFRQPPPAVETPRSRRGEMVAPQNGGGLWMTDWSGSPVEAGYMAFGYTAVVNNVFVLYGYLFDLSRGTPANAQVIGKQYLASTMDEKGARQVAHQFAADIIAAFGGKSLFGTHIYYVHQASSRSPKEIWVMDPDGKNQRQITHYNSLTIEPSISPDGSKIAFTSFVKVRPAIFVFSVDPVRDLRFYNQDASVNAQPSFTPDGKQIVYSSSARGCCRIFIANVDGSGFRPITSSSFIDSEPKVNPKGGSIVFSSGRSGPEQIYMMNMDGADIERLSDGTGEASNPAWNPDGQHIAYAWTRGYAAGRFNVFVMDIGSRSYVQLTHDEGKNENPVWAPDGAHLAFMSNRTGQPEIFTMLATGTQVQQLTHEGLNFSPVWGQ